MFSSLSCVICFISFVDFIRCNNINIFIRAKRLEKSKHWFEERVNQGGFLSASLLKNAFDSDEVDLVQNVGQDFAESAQQRNDQDDTHHAPQHRRDDQPPGPQLWSDAPAAHFDMPIDSHPSFLVTGDVDGDGRDEGLAVAAGGRIFCLADGAVACF